MKRPRSSSGTVTIPYCGLELEVDYDYTGILDAGSRDEPPDMGDLTIEKVMLGEFDITRMVDETSILDDIEDLVFDQVTA
jgi:hypothetical protein